MDETGPHGGREPGHGRGTRRERALARQPRVVEVGVELDHRVPRRQLRHHRAELLPRAAALELTAQSTESPGRHALMVMPKR